MRVLNYSILAVVFLLFGLTVSAKEKYDKKFHEVYDVNKETLFEISNKFGDIKISNTTENKITIDAEIVIEYVSKEKADKIFEKIKVNISKNGNTVSAKTEIDNISTNNASFEINYVISMPAYLAINLTNKYGDVTINELEGKSNLAVKYGSLNVNKITDGNTKPLSTIQLGYCERSQINEFNWGKIIIKYSKIEVLKGKALAISSKYSEVKLGNFSSIVAEAGYDDYKLNTVNNLVMNAKYTDINVERVNNKFNVENKYGNISVENIDDGFESINVISKYANVELGISSSASYYLNASTRYADLKHNELKIKERIKESNSYSVKGKAGSKETKAKVTVESEYGNVDLREN